MWSGFDLHLFTITLLSSVCGCLVASVIELDVVGWHIRRALSTKASQEPQIVRLSALASSSHYYCDIGQTERRGEGDTLRQHCCAHHPGEKDQHTGSTTLAPDRNSGVRKNSWNLNFDLSLKRDRLL